MRTKVDFHDFSIIIEPFSQRNFPNIESMQVAYGSNYTISVMCNVLSQPMFTRLNQYHGHITQKTLKTQKSCLFCKVADRQNILSMVRRSGMDGQEPRYIYGC